tara:strand:- start:23 stop:556 length:534 start_codon:yes stop_codon:yes gene_type:complete
MKQTQYSNFLPIIIAVLCGLKSYASAEAPKTFRVNDLTFERPEAWNWERPSSQMRKAQLSAPGKDGAADVVFFYFGPGGAGGVQANVDRWMGQFQNVSGKKTESKKIGGIPITFVQASGTFLSGPPFGQKVPKAGYALRGAIIGAKGGAIFIKMTGPKKTVEKAAPDFMEMAEKSLK